MISKISMAIIHDRISTIFSSLFHIFSADFCRLEKIFIYSAIIAVWSSVRADSGQLVSSNIQGGWFKVGNLVWVREIISYFRYSCEPMGKPELNFVNIGTVQPIVPLQCI